MFHYLTKICLHQLFPMVCSVACVIMLGSKPTDFLANILKLNITITLFEQENFCIVCGSAANRNSIFPEYDNGMINYVPTLYPDF